MKKSILVGTTWVGNCELLDCELVGVFASERSDALMVVARDQWACQVGRDGLCIVGGFRTLGEKSVLKNVLRCGGSAVWIVDHKLPTVYSRIYARAFVEGRLLVVSCFWIPRGIYGTVSYCAEVVQHLASRLVLWAPVGRGYLPQVAARARRNGKVVEVH